MSSLFTGSPARFAAVVVLAFAASAGCDNRSGETAGPAPTAATDVVASADPTATGVLAPPDAPASAAATKPPAAPAAGSSGDCVSYNPATVTVQYDAGVYSVKDGSRVVMRVHGQTGDTTGEKALALAQRFREHCFLGRGNTREEKNSYVFDYWRNPSGMKPAIAEQDEDCNQYNKNNLTVENMGGGHGWRVKDDDNVLHVFDNESDARGGKAILVKYNQICFIGSNDDDQEVVSYSR